MSRLDPSSQNKWPTITDRKHVMTFGKRKGYSIEDLIEADPQYLVWLVNNTDFDLDHKLVDEAEEAAAVWRP